MATYCNSPIPADQLGSAQELLKRGNDLYQIATANFDDSGEPTRSSAKSQNEYCRASRFFTSYFKRKYPQSFRKLLASLSNGEYIGDPKKLLMGEIPSLQSHTQRVPNQSQANYLERAVLTPFDLYFQVHPILDIDVDALDQSFDPQDGEIAVKTVRALYFSGLVLKRQDEADDYRQYFADTKVISLLFMGVSADKISAEQKRQITEYQFLSLYESIPESGEHDPTYAQGAALAYLQFLDTYSGFQNDLQNLEIKPTAPLFDQFKDVCGLLVDRQLYRVDWNLKVFKEALIQNDEQKARYQRRVANGKTAAVKYLNVASAYKKLCGNSFSASQSKRFQKLDKKLKALP